MQVKENKREELENQLRELKGAQYIILAEKSEDLIIKRQDAFKLLRKNPNSWVLFFYSHFGSQPSITIYKRRNRRGFLCNLFKLK